MKRGRRPVESVDPLVAGGRSIGGGRSTLQGMACSPISPALLMPFAALWRSWGGMQRRNADTPEDRRIDFCIGVNLVVEASGALKGTVRLKFWAIFNRLIVVGNHRFSAQFMGSLESHFQPNWR